MGAGWVCQASCPMSGLGFTACSFEGSKTFYFFPATLSGPGIRIPLGFGSCLFLCSVSFPSRPEGRPVCSPSACQGLGRHLRLS